MAIKTPEKEKAEVTGQALAIHVSRVIDVLSERLTPRDIDVWMKAPTRHVLTPFDLLKQGEIAKVLQLATETVQPSQTK